MLNLKNQFIGNRMRELFQSLNSYAVTPPTEFPPELLPLPADDPWSLEGAARRALGLLATGEQPGPRLYAYADYLATFITAADRWIIQPDAQLLNGTALALIGYFTGGKHPEAELWRLTGCARLATAAHERKAALEDKMLADCLLAVCRAADKTGAPILADLITLRERMWGRLLDHSRAERLHVSEDEYPAHMIHPVAPEALGALLRTRPWQIAARDPEYLISTDIEEAEGACRNLITLRAHMLVRHQFGSEIDWHLRLFDDIESTVGINAQHFIRNLAGAYAQTGDEKYAFQAARLLWSFYRGAPLPDHKQYLGPWRTLEVGSRQWRIWVDALGYLGQTTPFDDALHAMLARSRFEHMRYALAFCGGPNNWYQVEASGMAVAALCSPELKQAEAYLRIALRRLKWINSFAYYDDGFQFELSHGYHKFPTDAIFSVVQVARARSVQLPPDFVALVEKAQEMYLFSIQPDHLLPTFNDCNPVPQDPAPTLRFAAEVFNREDLRWGGSYGKEGTPPDHASHAWPSARYYVMRDKWGEDGQFLFFDGAAWGASHQHEDKLNFTLFANRRLLIGDPNIYSYSNTELTHYFKSSRGHNLILIDGKGQARRFRPQSTLTTLGKNEWVTRPQFDFVSSEYLEGYAPDPFPDRGDAGQVNLSFSHRRAIFYVKPGYWILCDLVKGMENDHLVHRLEQIFHLAPLYRPGEAVPIVAGSVSVSAERIRSENNGEANIAILPVDPHIMQTRAQKGETSPAVGWYGVLGEFPAWDVTLECKTDLPARLDVVLFPLEVGATATPAVQRLRQDAQVTAFSIRSGTLDDLFILCEEDAGPVTIGDVSFQGRALLLRRKPELLALAVALVDVRVGGKKLDAGR
jgi:hypothetical protein